MSFNPRTREGATLRHIILIGQSTRFNPRTREGATEDVLNLPESIMVSIHAPVRVRQIRPLFS